MSPKRIAGIVVMAGLAVFGGWRIWQAYQKQSAPQAARPGGPGGARVVSVSTSQAKAGVVQEEILVTGSLKPKEQVDVTPKATGRVERMHFQVGDAVKKGDLIAELEDDELQQQVNRAIAAQAVARASLAQREAELSNSRAELARTRTLFSEGLVPRQEFEAKQTGYEVVQAQVRLARAQEEQAQAELNELKIRLEQTKILAPMPGHIGRRYVDVGALVNPATPIVHLVNLSTMVTVANVPEREIRKLRVGNRATIQVDAFGDSKVFGRVARIGPVLDVATRSASVEVEIPNPDGGLKAEMFARVTLDLASTRPAVLIPREALVYRGQQPGVYVLESKRPVFRLVETGLTQGEDVEVLANLAAGTTVIARGASMLNEGDQIRIVTAGGEGRAGREGREGGGGKESSPREPAGGPAGKKSPAAQAEAGRRGETTAVPQSQ